MLHGHGNDYRCWLRYTGVERLAEEQRMAVVTFNSENKAYNNCAGDDRYEDFLAYELPEFMTYEYVYAVNKDYAHPEVLLHLVNFFNNRINSPEATEELLAEWGVDPVTGINKCAYAYGLVDPYGDKSINYNLTIRQALEGKLDPSELMPEAYRYWAPIQRYIDEGYAANGGYNPDDLTAWQYYMIHSHEGSWTRYAELADGGYITMASYYDDPTETMIRKWSALQALQEETFTKIIAGSEKIEAFDAFVEQWNKLGGDKITEEVNEKFGK